METMVRPAVRRQALYYELMAGPEGFGNQDTFARMVASQQTGAGVLPADLGLGAKRFDRLLAHYFPKADLCSVLSACHGYPDRASERAEICGLLLAHRLGEDESEVWMASVVAAGCMGDDHLWQDLGLWSRRDLTALMQRNFPRLAAKNAQDMKWKKFLYKQLCVQEGIYTCRAPSCQVCSDYKLCFGPE
jgi:nitrogen fixation protein NifQ